MGFPEQLLANRAQVLADHGEDITLYADAGEVSRKALIQRGIVRPIPETPGALRQMTTVQLANDATLGVAASAIDKGTFYIKTGVKIGDTAETLRIGQIVSQDVAWIVLEMR